MLPSKSKLILKIVFAQIPDKTNKKTEFVPKISKAHKGFFHFFISTIQLSSAKNSVAIPPV